MSVLPAFTLTGRTDHGRCPHQYADNQPKILAINRRYWSIAVAKAEWGSKRICPNCGARYYDLMKPLGEIVCPKCSTQFDPEAFLKTRRARVAAVPEKEIAVAVPEEAEVETGAETEEVEAADGEAAAVEGDEEEEEELIEDASELGEDEDDMAEVIENVEDEEER
jgi:uncharacterized protein (TIGR02300 family)